MKIDDYYSSFGIQLRGNSSFPIETYSLERKENKLSLK